MLVISEEGPDDDTRVIEGDFHAVMEELHNLLVPAWRLKRATQGDKRLGTTFISPGWTTVQALDETEVNVTVTTP